MYGWRQEITSTLGPPPTLRRDNYLHRLWLQEIYERGTADAQTVVGHDGNSERIFERAPTRNAQGETKQTAPFREDIKNHAAYGKRDRFCFIRCVTLLYGSNVGNNIGKTMVPSGDTFARSRFSAISSRTPTFDSSEVRGRCLKTFPFG